MVVSGPVSTTYRTDHTQSQHARYPLGDTQTPEPEIELWQYDMAGVLEAEDVVLYVSLRHVVCDRGFQEMVLRDMR